MKYQCIGTSLANAAPPQPPVAGVTPFALSQSYGWPAFEALLPQLLQNGDLDEFWHPLNSIVSVDNGYVQTTMTFNTLSGAQSFFNLVVDESLNVRTPTRVRSSKIVEVQDDGTVVRTVTQSNPNL